MNTIQKQVYESAFNYLGHTFKEAFENAKTKERKIEILNYIKCLNQMYMYTNYIEVENLKFNYEPNNPSQLRRLEQSRFANQDER